MRTTAQSSFPFASPPAAAGRALRSVGARSRIHVTLHSSDQLWELHAQRSEAALRAAVTATRALADFHVFHVSVRGDDVHLLVEAATADALAAGLLAFAGAAARSLRRATARIGPVFDGAYEARELRSSAEFRDALRLLIGPDRPEHRR